MAVRAGIMKFQAVRKRQTPFVNPTFSFLKNEETNRTQQAWKEGMENKRGEKKENESPCVLHQLWGGRGRLFIPEYYCSRSKKSTILKYPSRDSLHFIK